MTEEQAKKMGLVQLYKYSPKNEKLDTQYGRITIERWLMKEKSRIGRNISRIVRIVENDNGMLALFVNPVKELSESTTVS